MLAVVNHQPFRQVTAYLGADAVQLASLARMVESQRTRFDGLIGSFVASWKSALIPRMPSELYWSTNVVTSFVLRSLARSYDSLIHSRRSGLPQGARALAGIVRVHTRQGYALHRLRY